MRLFRTIRKSRDGKLRALLLKDARNDGHRHVSIKPAHHSLFSAFHGTCADCGEQLSINYGGWTHASQPGQQGRLISPTR